ncbi:hypothetical protein ACFE04_002193 [Oxalis oulophora]
MQVCSTWRAVSRSDLLWNRLTRLVWGRTTLLHDTWRDEFIYRHRTAHNFRNSRYNHITLPYDPSDVDDPDDGLICRCLTLSDLYLAAGFADGIVRLFHLHTLHHAATFRPLHREDRLGQFSRAVVGIVFVDSTQLVFATLDGDIHVALINNIGVPARRAYLGDMYNDGALVDFTGCRRFWIGLYAGTPGRAFHIWDSGTEALLFVGGTLTDPEAVTGWHMFTELTEYVGRVRVTSQQSAVACTSSRLLVFDLMSQELILPEQEYPRGITVTAFDVSHENYMVVDGRGVGIVRRVDDYLQEGRRLQRNVMGASQRNVMGCMNLGYALMCSAGVMRIWEVEHGHYLYRFRDNNIGEVNALVANDRHVAACGRDSTIHLWDFGANE